MLLPKKNTDKTNPPLGTDRLPPAASKKRRKSTEPRPKPGKPLVAKTAAEMSNRTRAEEGTSVPLAHPEDRYRDQRLVKDLTANAGDSVLSRHREHLTGTENEEDGVPEDEDALEEAAQKELDDDQTKTNDHSAHHPA